MQVLRKSGQCEVGPSFLRNGSRAVVLRLPERSLAELVTSVSAERSHLTGVASELSSVFCGGR